MKIGIFVSVVILCTFGPKVKAQTTDRFRVVGYYHSKTNDTIPYDVEKLTHIIYGFTFLDGNKITFKDETQERVFEGLVALKKSNPSLKVMISLGGWGGCETCSEIFSIKKNRKRFAASVKEMLVKYNADGFDVDWESPVIGGFKNHAAKAEDKLNFTALIHELRSALGSEHELSFAANSFKEYLDLSVDWTQVMNDVDFVNLMTFGLPNDKRGHTGHHSALYSSPWQHESIDLAIQRMDSMHIPLHKIVIGSAFYSFVVENVDTVNNGLGQPGKFKQNATYQQVVQSFTDQEGYSYHWDSVACAPFLYNARLHQFVTFDDKKSVAMKTNYALRKKLGGIMFWKLNGDLDSGGLLDAINEELKTNNKIHAPAK